MMLLWSCDKDFHDVYAPDELGMPEHEFYVEKAGGEIEIGYLSNKPGTVTLVEEADGSWLQFGTTGFDGDGTLAVTAGRNDGLQRRADDLQVKLLVVHAARETLGGVRAVGLAGLRVELPGIARVRKGGQAQRQREDESEQDGEFFHSAPPVLGLIIL